MEGGNNNVSYVLASFFVTKPESVDKIESQWKNRDSSHKNFKGRTKNQTGALKSEDFGGEIWLIKIEGKKISFLDKINCPVVTGISYDEKKGLLYAASKNDIKVIEKGKIKSILYNKLFNDLHDITITKDGTLMVASTGVDSILEIDPQSPKLAVWKWLATNHGFDETPVGEIRKIDEKLDYQNITTTTPEHTTHLNSCLCTDKKEVISTLFHQGKIISVNKEYKGYVELLKGLKCPHFVREFDNGYLVSDSRNNQVLVLDKNFNRKNIIRGDFDWVQDCIPLPENRILIADSNNYSLFLMDMHGNVENRYSFGKKKIFSFLKIRSDQINNIF